MKCRLHGEVGVHHGGQQGRPRKHMMLGASPWQAPLGRWHACARSFAGSTGGEAQLLEQPSPALARLGGARLAALVGQPIHLREGLGELCRLLWVVRGTLWDHLSLRSEEPLELPGVMQGQPCIPIRLAQGLECDDLSGRLLAGVREADRQGSGRKKLEDRLPLGSGILQDIPLLLREKGLEVVAGLQGSCTLRGGGTEARLLGHQGGNLRFQVVWEARGVDFGLHCRCLRDPQPLALLELLAEGTHEVTCQFVHLEPCGKREAHELAASLQEVEHGSNGAGGSRPSTTKQWALKEKYWHWEVSGRWRRKEGVREV